MHDHGSTSGGEGQDGAEERACGRSGKCLSSDSAGGLPVTARRKGMWLLVSLGQLDGALSPVSHIGYKRVMVSLGNFIGALNPVNCLRLYQGYGFAQCFEPSELHRVISGLWFHWVG